MTTNTDSRCAIWPGSKATRKHGSSPFRSLYDSSRAGGVYEITRDAELALSYLRELTDNQRIEARLTYWLVDTRRQGEERPLVTTQVIEHTKTMRDLNVDERADSLLKYLISQTFRIGEGIPIYAGNHGDWMDFGLAWSASISDSEVKYLLDYLGSRGYTRTKDVLTKVGGKSWSGLGTVVTVEGHARIADAMQAIDPSQAFVAMWFDPSLDDLHERGIKPAVEAAGYKPLRIDQKLDANKIDDEIIAEIRRSRFVVADFTHGESGARGGVYYEAGFAYGLNIPVIFTCRKDMFDNIHFDTRQYNHIGSAEPEDLIEPLKNRILARIGEGPIRRLVQ